MYGTAPAYHALKRSLAIYSKLFTMLLAFGHALREAHELSEVEKLSVGIMMVPPPFPSCERDLSVTRVRGPARQFDHQRLQMLDLAQRERACSSHREGRTDNGRRSG